MAEISNYDITRNKMRTEFLKYNQEKMIEKFNLKHDEDYLFIDFLRREYRIGRKTGIVDYSFDGYESVIEADFSESMTLYDLLCYSKDKLELSGRFTTLQMLKGTVQSSKGGIDINNPTIFAGKVPELINACKRFGEKNSFKGDVSFTLYPFDFLPVVLQFWDEDDEFPPNIKFMFDENILDYMHFETVYYMMGCIIKRICECL